MFVFGYGVVFVCGYCFWFDYADYSLGLYFGIGVVLFDLVRLDFVFRCGCLCNLLLVIDFGD